MKKIVLYTLLFMPMLFLLACKKDWLEKKYDIKLIVPTTLRDMRLLLNNTTIFQISYLGLGEVSSDNIYIPSNTLTTLLNPEKGAYLWADDVFSGQVVVGEWDAAYRQVFTCNVILEQLEKITPQATEQTEWNDLKGAALFFRAKAFFDLATIFTVPFNHNQPENKKGIHLRLQSNINAPIGRASLKETYNKIISDLELASSLLRTVPKFKSDASKFAAIGLLARVNLSIGNYVAALNHANQFLGFDRNLIDFNDVALGMDRPFAQFNLETIFFSKLVNYRVFNTAYVDPLLISSYNEYDLRGRAYFKLNANGFSTFKGSFTGDLIPFGGIGAAEMLLISAECHARQDNIAPALANLNFLLTHRYKKGHFIYLTASDNFELLKLVLVERRKELVFRGIRWTDLRRLNFEPQLQITLVRNNAGTVSHLEPGSTKYVFEIPDYVVASSGLEQNKR